jgi:hypothetical protein
MYDICTKFVFKWYLYVLRFHKGLKYVFFLRLDHIKKLFYVIIYDTDTISKWVSLSHSYYKIKKKCKTFSQLI